MRKRIDYILADTICFFYRSDLRIEALRGYTYMTRSRYFQDMENFHILEIFQDIEIILDMEVKYHTLYCTAIGRIFLCHRSYKLCAYELR